MAKLIQIRRDTASAWQNVNPTLAQGELAYETDTGRFKIGDGITAWNDLPYIEFGAKTFLELEDTPDSYSGYSRKLLAISDDESQIYFIDPVYIDRYVRVSETDTQSGFLTEKLEIVGDATPVVENQGAFEKLKLEIYFGLAKIYTSGESYKQGHLITDDGFSKLYIATQDFTASDLVSDVSNGYLKELVPSITPVYRTYDVSGISSGDSVTITLDNPNVSFNRHVFVLQQIGLPNDTRTYYFTTGESNNYNFDSAQVLFLNGLTLDHFRELETTSQDFYTYAHINTNDYRDIYATS